MSLKAGVARRSITNRKPLFLVGYPHVNRISQGVHDPLWASALCLDNGDRALVFVAVDILFIHHETAAECRHRIAEQTGIPPDHILISATHTHSGPVTSTMLSWRDDPIVHPPDPEYMSYFKDGIVEAAVTAARNTQPADIAMTTATSEGVGCNRLDPQGPRDPEVNLIMVRRRTDRQPLALHLVYAMHPTVLHEDSLLVSSDFPHYTRRIIEHRWPGITVLYHNGPSGNLSPRYHVREQTFAEAERLGTRLGKHILAQAETLNDAAFTTDMLLAAATAAVTLPPRTFGPLAEAQRELEAARAEYARLQAQGSPHGPLRTAECTIFGAEERLTLARAEQEGETARLQQSYNPVQIQVLRLGDGFRIGFPGECFVEYGLEVKQRLPNSAVICLANGELQGYIPTPDATGYEARLSFFKPEAGSMMVETALALAEKL